jgi:hypothetical protein
MKKEIVCLFAALFFFAGLNQFANAATVTFTNLPAAVSNTYTGTITLLISNVPAGHTVVCRNTLMLTPTGSLMAGTCWCSSSA